jgi:hypothetical protein
MAIHVACEAHLERVSSPAVPAVTPPPAPAPGARPAPPRPPGPPAAAAPPTPKPAKAAAPAFSPKPVKAPAGNKSALSAVDEAAERWLIQKDKLDFGPFRIAEVRHQIEKGQISGDHTIIDMENGERRRVKDHPLLAELVGQAEGKLEAGRQAKAAEDEARRHKKQVVVVLSLIALVLVAGGGVAAYLVFVRGWGGERVVYRDRFKQQNADDLLKGIEITMKVDPPAPKGARHHHGGHGAGGKAGDGSEFDSATNLGDATSEGGDETLGQDVVQKVMVQNFGILKGCVFEERQRDHAMKHVDMEFIIRGTGQVSAVKVNGSTNSPFAACMFAKMQTVSFPRFNGSRTHASFSLALK